MRRSKRRSRERDLAARLERNLEISNDPARPRRVRTKAARYSACLAEQLGIITRPRGCTWCRRRLPLERHHWDYDDPLGVVYLCHDCHAIADGMADTDSDAA